MLVYLLNKSTKYNAATQYQQDTRQETNKHIGYSDILVQRYSQQVVDVDLCITTTWLIQSSGETSVCVKYGISAKLYDHVLETMLLNNQW